MSIISVSTTAELISAVVTARAGDEIKLAAGTYSDVWWKGANFSSAVTITSADPGNPAVITDLWMANSSNLTFSNVNFEIKSNGNVNDIQINGSSNITFDNIEVSGPALTPGSSSYGLWIRDSSSVTVRNSTFHDLGNGIITIESDGLTVVNSTFHHLASDGIQIAATSNVAVTGNLFTDFHVDDGNHPDAVQIFTAGAATSAKNILISDNLIVRGDGDPMQGIFVTDQVGNLAFENVTITNNVLIGTMYNGIGLGNVASGTVSGNTVIGQADMTSWIRMESAAGVSYSNNSATGYVGFASAVPAGNTLVGIPQDLGYASISSWAAAHSAAGTLDSSAIAQLAGMGVTAVTLPPSVAPTEPAQITAPTPPPHYAPGSGEVTAPETVAPVQTVTAPETVAPVKPVTAPDPVAPVKPVIITGTSGDETLRADKLATSTIYGLNGNDILHGNGAASDLRGGKGDDTYFVSGSGDSVVEAGKEGTDTVYASINYTLGTNLESLFLQGSAVTGTGNKLNNSIIGNGLDNILYGLDGEDSLAGGGGNDTIYGGKGADTLYGEAGNDILYGDDGSDKLFGGAGNDVLDGGKGDNSLDGGTGDDRIYGGSGKDIFVFRNEVAVSHDRDEVFNFAKGKDFINLTQIDANTRTTADDAFKFIGNSDFHRVAGELQVKSYGDGVMVSGDVNGDALPDFQIYVHNIATLAGSNFHL